MTFGELDPGDHRGGRRFVVMMMVMAMMMMVTVTVVMMTVVMVMVIMMAVTTLLAHWIVGLPARMARMAFWAAVPTGPLLRARLISTLSRSVSAP